jgi:hypothetical protein
MPHLSDQSRTHIERALHRAAKECLVRNPGDTCSILESRTSVVAATAGEKLILVTISSFKFRLLVIFHIDEDSSLATYFSGRNTQGNVEEAFYEIANMCCGALNRQLTRDFRHLAMSVPYTLSGTCMTYIGDLRPEYVSSSTVRINENIAVRITLCMCCSAPVSFSTTASESESNSGALELF